METLEEELGYDVHTGILDARFLVPQHRERLFFVGFRTPRRFKFPILKDQRPRIQDILEPDPSNKYTLSERLWRYLRDYAKKHQDAGNGFGFGLANLEGVSRTLSARYYKDGSEILVPRGRGARPRRLTPRECARLMGFPESFKIPVSDTQAYRQFGNSVVVPVASAVANEVVRALMSPAIRKPRQVPLSLTG
jgi:DNA (cytosine-5)-methyltransferase 1